LVTLSSPRLFWTVLRTLGSRVIWAGFLKLGTDLLSFVGPNIIGNASTLATYNTLGAIIRFMEDPNIPSYWGYIYVLIMLISVLAQSLFQNHHFFVMFSTGMQVNITTLEKLRTNEKTRSALNAIIYKKSFLLSSKSRQKSTIGEIVNHQAIDAARVRDVMPWFHLFWSCPFQILVAMVLLYRSLGYAMLAGVAVMSLTIPINFFMAK
jgi:ATP-binding cassette subfamily C (CFTR/MRP) protein 1